jgi:hypothetical protein
MKEHQKNNPEEIFDIQTYRNEFISILEGINNCYFILSKSNTKLINHEEKIRNVLLKDYLQNREIKKKFGLMNYRFEAEGIAGIDDNYKETGYTDIKVISRKTFETEDYDYIFECKRLDGGLHLNREYLTEGIYRFVSEKYYSKHGIYGMIGFVVKKIDIDENIEKIKQIEIDENLKLNTVSNIQKNDKYFQSKHFTEKQNNIVIYHTMMNFSDFFKLKNN